MYRGEFRPNRQCKVGVIKSTNRQVSWNIQMPPMSNRYDGRCHVVITRKNG